MRQKPEIQTLSLNSKSSFYLSSFSLSSFSPSSNSESSFYLSSFSLSFNSESSFSLSSKFQLRVLLLPVLLRSVL